MLRLVEAGAGPSPFNLKADYKMDCPLNVGEAIGMILTAATLFLVPHPETCNYSIRLRAYVGREQIDERNYQVTHQKLIQLFGGTQYHEDVEGIDKVLDQLESDQRTRPSFVPPVQQKPDAST